MSSNPGHWVCQACRKPTGPDGIVEVININIDLGPIGSYPLQASDNERLRHEEFYNALARKKGVARENLSVELGELRDMPHANVNIGFTVRHLGCIADKEIQGYWFETARANTLEQFAGWVLHLKEKSWMDSDDLLRMLRFWWSHKGEQPPHGM